MPVWQDFHIKWMILFYNGDNAGQFGKVSVRNKMVVDQ